MSAVKMIYAGIRAVGIQEEDDRRALFERVTGKRRLRQMTPADKDRVVAELRRLGFQGPTSRKLLTGPYAKKLQALWIAGWNLGLVHNRNDEAIIAFVKRQTGLDHARWLRDPADGKRVVEALKDWLAREAGVMWGNTQGYDWLKDHGGKIAWAQWRRLYPAADLRDQTAFRAKVLALVPGKDSLDRLTSADWREVCNAFGRVVRKGA
ncbi:regulatory protein GemA [Paracoccus denitrificans]|uniref:regulatory protein GemA n=1 Tax=Paracoccus denitrificans TaxID=266 RepID=UPI003364DE1F